MNLLKRDLKTIEKEYWYLKPVADVNDIINASKEIEKVYVDSSIFEYIANIVEYSHRHEAVQLGITPRGALMLLQLAKEFALADERDYVIPDDVKNATVPALAHRFLIKPEFLAEGYTGERIVQEILANVEIPRP
ncbi:MAG: MoxR family ATPase [Ignisphaera sp.]